MDHRRVRVAPKTAHPSGPAIGGEGSPAVEVRNPAGTVDLQAEDGTTEYVVDVVALDSAAEEVLEETQERKRVLEHRREKITEALQRLG